jgi:hypothetical protein
MQAFKFSFGDGEEFLGFPPDWSWNSFQQTSPTVPFFFVGVSLSQKLANSFGFMSLGFEF